MRVALRRYVVDDALKCASSGYYHDAETPLGEFHKADVPPLDKFPREDLRWPQACKCGFAFRPTDNWQVFDNKLWRDSRNGKLVTLDEAEPGAMYAANWMSGMGGSIHWEKRGGGPHLIVKLPGGHYWDVDSKSRNGDGWTRTGEPPNVTASPSIGIYGAEEGEPWRYHGFLKDGKLDPC